MAKLISFWSGESGVGRLTVARALAQFWSEEKKDVLLIECQKKSAVHDPAAWLPRFQPLSPAMLRNFLAGSEGSFGRLSISSDLDKNIVSDLLALASQAYRWILIVGGREPSLALLPVIDASDLLLWVTHVTAESPKQFQIYLDQLTKFHFPHNFVHVVANRWNAQMKTKGEVPQIIPGKPLLAAIPDSEDLGFSFQEAVRHLAGLLEHQPDLARVRHAQDSENSSKEVIEQIRQRVQPRLLEALEGKPHLEAATAQETVEACLAKDTSLPTSREVRSELLARVLDDVLGLGPLEPLVKDPSISEIMVNGPRCIYVERKGKLHAVDIQFSSEKQLRTVIDRIVAPIGRRVDESMPLCDARLADGSRVNIVLPPLALDGSTITIRKFSARSICFDDLVNFGSMSPAMSAFLQKAVEGKGNIVVSGGTGSGKTTLLNALSSAIPDDERIVTIEDAAELRLQKPHVVRMESRPANAEGQGAVPIRRLVINALRMRPDRIVVGECRGGEALDMLQAMNTGHDGSMTTVHANAPRDALGRLETLVLMAGMDLPIRVVREQIRSAVHLIVQQARLADGSRKVTSITEVTGMEGDTLTIQELFRFQSGHFESTGIVSRFSKR